MGLEFYTIALWVFLAAALSDALDGYLARLLKQDTPIGRQLDPLVDKVIVSGCYIYLAAMSEKTGVYPWMVTAIVVRELLIQGLRSLLEGQGLPFGARTAGKLKTTVQCVSITAALLGLSMATPPSWLLWLRDISTWLAVVLTIYSGAVYLVSAMPVLRSQSTRD
jgi:CDP-diacylglycerol--glycerol-3-phosphate 3-phosphatidyltransferase